MNESDRNMSVNSFKDIACIESWLKDVWFYSQPFVIVVGVLFNQISIFSLLLPHYGVRLRRSLAIFFAFLNVFDSIFLICIFFVFQMPKLSSFYTFTVPILMPILHSYHKQ